MATATAEGSSVGHCGVTDVGGDCAKGDQGAWDAARIGATSLDQCAAHCLASCPRCAYVSFHAGHKDCSWYSSCPKLHYSFGGNAYRSRQVRTLTSHQPPPPPPPAWVVPHSAAPGFCALMGPGLGDCSRDEQGSWPGVRSPAECVHRCRSCERCRFVSFTPANATEGVADRSGGLRRHPPYWWRCRWFAHCDMHDLRRSPPPTEPWQYATRRVKHEPLAPSVAAPAAAPSPSALAVTTLLEARPRRPEYGKQTGRALGEYGTYGGALVQWCQNARRLGRLLPAHWRAATAIFSSDVRRLNGWLEESGLLSAAACGGVQLMPVDEELRAAAMTCARKVCESPSPHGSHPTSSRLTPPHSIARDLIPPDPIPPYLISSDHV
jgi:hypothetical protein